MGTRVLYGPRNFELELGLVQTQSLTHTPVMSDDGMDYLYTKTDYECTAYLNALLTPTLMGQPPAQTEAAIRSTLQLPRQQLWVIVGGPPGTNPNVSPPSAGTLLLQSPGANASVDAKGGPFPTKFEVKNITGTSTFKIGFAVTTYLLECFVTGPPAFISNRYEQEVTMDEKFYTTLRTTGKAIINAAVGPNPDALRAAVVPIVQTGFKRISLRFWLASDGLSLRYEAIDKEQYLQPPAPACKASGTYRESTPFDQAVRIAEVTVRLESSKGTDAGNPKATLDMDKGALLAQAILIAQGKLNDAVNANGGQFKGTLWATVIGTEMWDTVVEVIARARIAANQQTTKNIWINLQNFLTFPAGSDPATTGEQGPDPGMRATADLNLLAASLNQACTQQVFLQANPLPDQPAVAVLSSIADRVLVSVVPVNPDGTSALVSPNYPAIMDTYQVHARSEEHAKVVQLATASSAPGTLAAFFQLAAPIARVWVNYSAETTGAKPQIPFQNDPNMALLQRITQTEECNLAADGQTLKYKASGQLLYGLVDATKIAYLYAVPPFMQPPADASLVAITTQDLNGNIINPTGQPEQGYSVSLGTLA